jgi:hypothetical protein
MHHFHLICKPSASSKNGVGVSFDVGVGIGRQIIPRCKAASSLALVYRRPSVGTLSASRRRPSLQSSRQVQPSEALWRAHEQRCSVRSEKLPIPAQTSNAAHTGGACLT